MKTAINNALLLCLLLAPAAPAAGPREGIGTAKGEAEFRAADAVLVEIEGFVSPEGDIPCAPRSYSNNWHYKFHLPSSGEWLLVNACGDGFMNVARHLPARRPEEPVQRLPVSFAAPEDVLKKMADDGVFRGTGDAGNRGILMKLRHLPAKDGREAGCYWTVSQGKAKALADCGAEKTWKPGGGKAAPAGAAGPPIKGGDTAGRYPRLAAETARAKYPGARLLAVEALVDRTGSAKCLIADDGWTFVFYSPELSSTFTVGACRDRTALGGTDFAGKFGGLNTLDPVPLQFKDSDAALSQAPPSCVKNYSTLTMKLRNFKPQFAPFAGHNLVWSVDCGSARHLLDGHTGAYLGPGKK
ncbi:MAG: hypothetical protein HY550_10930 [Elusimicrobia bacterium]|nr:hypothetical protein [Elusimicrobiota bacterium]